MFLEFWLAGLRLIDRATGAIRAVHCGLVSKVGQYEEVKVENNMEIC